MNAKQQKALTETSFSDLLLERGLIEAKDLAYALRVRAWLEKDRPMGEILVGLGVITRSQLKKLLREHKTRIRTGDLLVENGTLGASQLLEVLAIQKKQPHKKLGAILVEGGYVSEIDLLKALSQQKDIPFIEPSLAMLDDALMAKIPVKYLFSNGLLPLSLEDKQLRVIVSDFPEPAVADELQNVYGCELRFALATAESIQHALSEYRSQSAPSLAEASVQNRTIAILDGIIADGLRFEASDIHLEPLPHRCRLRYRIDGVLVHHTDFPKEMERSLISCVKVLAGADIAEHRHHQDGHFKKKIGATELDIRVSIYVTVDGENVVMRLLNKLGGLLDLEEMGMHPRMLQRYRDFVLQAPAGVVVITGPTGSGKTTTLYSSIDACNGMDVKIITAEDPVEYQIEGIMQCSINPKVGLSFDDTLKAIVRQDPDIIVLGEIRDRISAQTAIQAALTGHKVFTTFHTEDSVGGLLRLMDMGIETFLISSTVICMVAQRLVRRICDHCKEECAPTLKELFLLGLDASYLAECKVYQGRGCPRCHSTGYRGRTVICELLVLDEQVKDSLLARKTAYRIREQSVRSSGLVTLRESGIVKVVQGITSLSEVLSNAPPSFPPRPVHEILQLLGEPVY